NSVGPQLWGQQNLSVVGADVHDLVLRTQPGVTVSGRLQVARGATGTLNLGSLRVLLLLPSAANASGPTPVRTIQFGPGGATKADGTFEIANQPPGGFMFVVGGLPKGWTALSAMAGDRDLLDGPVNYPLGTTLSDVVVTLTDQHTEISGG